MITIKSKVNRHLLTFILFLILYSQLVSADDTLTPAPISGRHVVNDDLLPSDVLARVKLCREEIDLIRLEMGQSAQPFEAFAVNNAAPREVFFQALSLFRKANRLSYELTGMKANEPKVPERHIYPADVWKVVDSALKRILLSKKALAIRKTAVEKHQESSKQPSDVYRSIVQANRQINSLLEKRFSPSDVFQRVTLAINYTSNLLDRYPELELVTLEQKFVRRKRPVDVYHLLVECFELINAIAKKADLKMLSLPSDETKATTKTPSDVYDMASLLISELDYLHKQLPNSPDIRKSYYPGSKLPSHVFQRASLLKDLLMKLKKSVDKNPKNLITG